MRSSPHMLTGYNNRISWQSRVSAIVLSLGIMALIILALLQLGALSAFAIFPATV